MGAGDSSIDAIDSVSGWITGLLSACHRWHAVGQRRTDGTEFTRQMLHWECGQQYYAGQGGTPSRHSVRQSLTP
jgi:hypothetical protein